MKVLKDMRQEMDVYIVGHVSYDRPNDVMIHEDDVEIGLLVNGKSIGKLRTDGHVQVLNTQQFRIFCRDLLREKDDYPSEYDVIKVTNSEPSKIKLVFHGSKTLSKIGVKMTKYLSSYDEINVEDLFIEFSETSTHFGIYSLEEFLEDELV